MGHILLAVNGLPVTNRQLDDGRDAFEVIENKENYPLNLKFGRSKMTTNEKIFLASMFYPLFAIASQLSPEPKCSGIEILESDTFKLYCFQTLTGKLVTLIEKLPLTLRYNVVLINVICRCQAYGSCRTNSSRHGHLVEENL